MVNEEDCEFIITAFAVKPLSRIDLLTGFCAFTYLWQKGMNRFVVFLLLALSGFPILSQNRDLFLFLGLIFLLLLVIKRYGTFRIFKNRSLFIVFSVLSLIFIIQSFTFDNFTITSLGGLIARIIIAFCIYVLLQKSFLKAFVDTMYFLAFCSLLIYGITLLFPQIQDYGFSILEHGRLPQKSVILYNFMSNTGTRLIGPFWEPGAFAGFIVLAFYFNIFYLDSVLFSKVNIVLTLTLLLTFSTSGYLSLFLVIFLFLLFKRGISNKLWVIPVTIFAAIVIMNFSFLGDKLQTQYKDYEKFVSSSHKVYNSQRFISTFTDFQDFKKYPILGTGISHFTRFERLGHQSAIRTNGVIDILLKFGILGFITIIYSYLNHFRSELYNAEKRRLGLVTFFILLLINLSQLFFYLPFFMVFYFKSQE